MTHIDTHTRAHTHTHRKKCRLSQGHGLTHVGDTLMLKHSHLVALHRLTHTHTRRLFTIKVTLFCNGNYNHFYNFQVEKQRLAPSDFRLLYGTKRGRCFTALKGSCCKSFRFSASSRWKKTRPDGCQRSSKVIMGNLESQTSNLKLVPCPNIYTSCSFLFWRRLFSKL